MSTKIKCSSCENKFEIRIGKKKRGGPKKVYCPYCRTDNNYRIRDGKVHGPPVLSMHSR